MIAVALIAGPRSTCRIIRICNYHGYRPLVCNHSVVERLKQCLDHLVQLLRSDLSLCCVVLQSFSRLLPAGACLERCFFQKQLLKIICGVEVRLIAGGDENGGDLFSL
jgi:hypothetical protein